MQYVRENDVSLVTAIASVKNKLSWTIDKSDPLMKHPHSDEVIVLVASDEFGNYCIIGCMFA